MFFCNFKLGLNQEKCLHHLQLACGNKVLSHVTVFKWFTECHRCQNSLLDEEHAGKSVSCSPTLYVGHMMNAGGGSLIVS